MHQIKIFKGLEGDLTGLEQQINDFLADGNKRVVQITGNIAPQSETQEHHADDRVGVTGGGGGRGGKLGGAYTPSDVLIVVLYETDGLA